MTKPSAYSSPPPPTSGKSHPSWNSLVSDITMSGMSDDEEFRPSANSRSNSSINNATKQANGQYPTYQLPLPRNENSVASLLEYSHSSEENIKSREPLSTRTGQLAKCGATSFRLRDDLTQSNRVVQFGVTSDSVRSDTTEQQIAAEEGATQLPRVYSNLPAKHHDKKRSRRHRHHHEPHRSSGSTVNRETFLTTSNRILTNFVYSFNTPPAPRSRKTSPLKEGVTKEKPATSDTRVIPKQASLNADVTFQNKDSFNGEPLVSHLAFHRGEEITNLPGTNTTKKNKSKQSRHLHSESTPLLPFQTDNNDSTTYPGQGHLYRHHIQYGQEKLFPSRDLQRTPYDYISIAVAFLKDYEAEGPPTLPSDVTWISTWQMRLYSLKFSIAYKFTLGSAMVALFLSSALEGPSALQDSNKRMQRISALNLYALIILGCDLWIRSQFQSRGCSSQRRSAPKRISQFVKDCNSEFLPVQVQTRPSQANLLTRPLFLFGIFLAIETVAWLLAAPDRTFVVLYSSIAKPIVLYYVSRQARHAMEALVRITRTVIRVLVIELVLILVFAAVACQFFNDFASFEYLAVAWLSLFKLATTVVNPSIWMPMYQKNHSAAFFFIIFIVVTVFYMHSLVLSVVFQTYIQAATEIHDRSVTDREDGLQLAFMALQQQDQLAIRIRENRRSASEGDRERKALAGGIPMYLVREVLEDLRPHYSVMKINALVEFFDTKAVEYVDYPTFRSKMKQALNASIRTSRVPSSLAMSIELTAVVAAMVNFLYVILLSSSFNAKWFTAIQLQLGALITLLGVTELIMRTNPLRVQNFTPMTRFNGTFDGLAILAAVISCVGIIMALLGQSSALKYILMGRAIDMIRVMRFFQIFRDVVRRSSEVVPALLGPITLVVTMLHIFVYVGMAFWGGAIEVGVIDQITPLYDLNNFNSYSEGMVTMFQVLVVNDWHAIAEVFLFASRCSDPRIVYPFFILGNLVGVSILLNVITAFFVESFVSKLGGSEKHTEQPTISPPKEFSIRASENRGVRRNGSIRSISHIVDEVDTSGDNHDADSTLSSDSSELFEFDVYEREGYDKIVATVIGGADQDDYAKQVCNQLELFESLSPGREKVGYLVCCQQTMNRYGNRRFETEAAGFIDKVELHALVSNMHSELLVLMSSTKISLRDRSLIRVYPHPTDFSQKLEISATIVRRNPALSLFVTRIVTS